VSRVLRLLIYDGNDELLRQHLARRGVQSTRNMNSFGDPTTGIQITEVFITATPISDVDGLLRAFGVEPPAKGE